ncbi:MAG: HlyD family efflux transporter periplasmic adaptor subunit [Caldimonas sp.]
MDVTTLPRTSSPGAHTSPRGVLSRITLREGDAVEAGTVVAVLMPALAPMVDERTLREQQVRVEIAEAQVQHVAARIERARVALLQTNNDVLRTEQLARQGFVSPTKLDTDRLTTLAAQKELDAAGAERRIALYEVEQARTALMTVRSAERRPPRSFELRAPVAGRVLRVAQTSETAIGLGTPLLEIGDTQGLEIVADLLTADALQAKPGRRVLIERWGGDAALEGRVRLVEPAGFTKVSALGVEEQRVKVLIDIVSPAEQWRDLGDAYRVGVRILTLAIEDAVKVPVSAVFPLPQRGTDPSLGMAVFTIVDGRARRVQVDLGGRNGTDAWLRAGLPAGAAVIVYPPASIQDGTRVKIRSV